MELTQLSFRVDTKQLLDAKTAIADLGVAVNKLNKITSDETKTAIDSEKVKQAQAKTAGALADQLAKEEKARLASTKAAKSSNETSKESISVLEKQQSILQFMADGFSRGQATILTYAKASGSATDEIKQLGEVLQTQRRLIGGDVFDKSMSGIVALKNQYGEIREAMRQYNDSTGLTRNQTRELTRDKERLIEKLKTAGASFSDIKVAIRAYNAEYIEAANKVNSLISVEREHERVIREKANALRFLENAESKAATMVATYNSALDSGNAITERSATNIAAYALKLKQAGIAGVEAANRLKTFSAQQEFIAAQERKQQEAYLTRAIIPQFSDIFVGLTTGQKPLTVMLQQLPQIQDLFTLTGVKAQDTVKVIGNAASEMFIRLKDTGIAVFQAVGVGFKSLGQSVLDTASKFGVLGKFATSAREELLSYGPPTKAVSESLQTMDKLLIAAGGGIVGLVALVALLGVELYKTSTAIDKMNESLVLYGARLGLTRDQLTQLSNSTAGLTTSSNEMKAFFGELIKGGFTSKNALEAVAKSSKELAAVSSLSLSDIAKEYKELAKDPVDALIKLGIETGNVSVKTVEHVRELKKQGKEIEAVDIAVLAMANSNSTAAKQIEKDMSPLSALFLDIKKAITEIGEALNWAANQGAGLTLKLGNKLSNIDVWVKAMSLGRQKNAGEISQEEYDSQISALIKKQEDADQRLRDLLAGRKSDAQTEQETQANQMAAYKKYLEEMKKFEDEKYKLQAKGMTRQQYIDRKMQELSGKVDGFPIEDVYAKAARTKFGEEYDKFTKPSSDQKRDDKEKQRLKDLADYYTAQVDVGFKAYNKDYQKNLDDLEKIRGQLTPEAFVTARTIIEKDQPYFKKRTQDEENQKRITNASEDYTRTLQQQRDLQLIQIDSKIKEIGLTEEQRLVNEQLAKVEEDRVRNLKQIEDLVANSKLTGTELDEYRNKLKQTEKTSYEETKKVVEARTRLAYDETHSFEAGWKNAFAAYNDIQKNSAALGKKFFEDMTSGMADMLTEFVTTGKLKVSDFASHFIKEMIRAQMQSAAAQVTGGIGSFLGPIFKTVVGSLIGAPSGPLAAAPGMSYPVGAGGEFDAAASTLMSLDSGGYTGPGGVLEPAGIVHKGEVVWSQEDIARAGGVGVVEGLRKGLGGYSSGLSPSAYSTAQKGNQGIQVNIENYGTSKDFEVQQLSESEIRIIARNEAKTAIQKDTPRLVSSQIRNPNSDISKSLSQNTQTQRRR